MARNNVNPENERINTANNVERGEHRSDDGSDGVDTFGEVRGDTDDEVEEEEVTAYQNIV